ncbi:hypothetical protein [Allosalinactinospora lopnorensis]|uniref:hypothetical protein n=1 Tax=Allosalinactinospora lopnorensis TaxID=1352348 RepID=UPI0006991562|nr:hypothetical protein [Allosalinactinospora lopnorensis]
MPAIALMVGCSAPDDTEAPPNGQGGAEEIDPEQAEAVEEVYRDVRGIYIDAMSGEHDLEDLRPELEERAAGQALDSLVADVERFQEVGQVFEGEPEISTEVTALTMDTDPPAATLEDCWDDSNWRPVDAETGEPVPTPDKPERRVIKVRAEQDDSDAWVLTEWRPEEGRTC